MRRQKLSFAEARKRIFKSKQKYRQKLYVKIQNREAARTRRMKATLTRETLPHKTTLRRLQNLKSKRKSRANPIQYAKELVLKKDRLTCLQLAHNLNIQKQHQKGIAKFFLRFKKTFWYKASSQLLIHLFNPVNYLQFLEYKV